MPRQLSHLCLLPLMMFGSAFLSAWAAHAQMPKPLESHFANQHQPWRYSQDEAIFINDQIEDPYFLLTSQTVAGLEDDEFVATDVTTPEVQSTFGDGNILPLPQYEASRPFIMPGDYARGYRGLTQEMTWQLLPRDLIYKSYLAGVKEPRMRSVFHHDNELGWIWDISLGGRIGLVRYGTQGPDFPQGFQMDLEGASLLRLDTEEERDLAATDFRAGVPLTYGFGRWQTKLAYYHLSSHIGDEFLIKNPNFERINYVRDAIVLGLSYYISENLRVYGEAAWAFFHPYADPWELQFGIDYSPYAVTSWHGAPFWALNGHLRQELNFGGNFVGQAGWQWRGRPGGSLFRVGMEYYNGASEQWEFIHLEENKLGLGLWYDY